MLAKKFFINTGINITVETNNGSYSRWRNHPHTITLPHPNFTVFLDQRSPFLRLTNLLPLDPNKLNLHSSLKWTIFHCSSDQCGEVKTNLLIFFEIKSLWQGIWATNFSLFNLRETDWLSCLLTKCMRSRCCWIETIF